MTVQYRDTGHWLVTTKMPEEPGGTAQGSVSLPVPSQVSVKEQPACTPEAPWQRVCNTPTSEGQDLDVGDTDKPEKPL